MWLRNTAGQGFSFTIKDRATGLDLDSGTVTVTRRLDGGTPGAAGGTATITGGNGYYAASQADTDASVCEFYLRHADGVTVERTIPTFQTIAQMQAAIAAAVRDVNNTSPASNSLGASINSGGGPVTLATSQPNYAPAKAGDAMTLTSGERTSFINAFGNTVMSAFTTDNTVFYALRMLLGLLNVARTKFLAVALEDAPTGGGGGSADDYSAQGEVAASPTPTSKRFKVTNVTGRFSPRNFIVIDEDTLRGFTVRNLEVTADGDDFILSLRDELPAAPTAGDKVIGISRYS